MRAFFLIPSVLVTISLLSGCGTALVTSVDTSSSTASVSVSAPDLRRELEKTYTSIRTSIDEATPDTYFQYVQDIKNTAGQLRSSWSNSETKNVLKNFVYPDLAKIEFIKVEQNGDWAAYYYLSDLDQQDRLTINVARFHRVNGVWLAYPKTGVSSIPYEGGTPQERQQAIATEIQENTTLSVIPPADNATSSN